MSLSHAPKRSCLLAALLLVACCSVPGIAAAQDAADDEEEVQEEEADEDEADADVEADEEEADADVEADEDEADADEETDEDAEGGDQDAEADEGDDQDAGDGRNALRQEEGDVDEADADADDADDLAALPEDDIADDGWAGAWQDEAEADDTIPVDRSRFGSDEVWLVEDEGEGDASDEAGDTVGGGLPTIRTVKRGAAAPGRKPPRRAGDDDDTVYSFGGLPVSAQAVPWQAQILYPAAPAKPGDKRPAWQRQHYCGGALIAPEWVVTAAHCIDQLEVDLGFKVRLGAQDISKGDGVLYRIERIVRHSQYNAESNDLNNPPNMYANDIALVRIAPAGAATPLDSRRVRQIPINRAPLPPAAPVSATGWGVTGSSEAANAMNAVLLRVDLRAMPNQVCQARPGYGPQKIGEGVFCAAHPQKSTCRGDSGGPVVLTNGTPLLVGIVSWGKKACAGDGRPGVYTRIDRYVQWIEQAMKLPPGQNRLP